MNTRYPLFVFIYSLVFVLPAIISCSNRNPKETTEEYKAEVDQWHQQRIASLKEKDSWLTLAGLYPLENGTYTFGADSSNDIVFPPKTADYIGTITRSDTSFYVDINQDITVYQDSATITEMPVKTTLADEPTRLRQGSLLWYIIERRGNYYIRLKDQKHPNLTSFEGIPRFPVDANWRIKASFKAYDQPETINMPDILGETYEQKIYGELVFTDDGNQYSVAPIGHPKKDKEFFIVLGDKTNGESTYSGGRYIYIPTPDEQGNTYIDFNKAYNPPCVFTSFATCPLPPAQNRLSLEVTAGEKMYQKKQ